MIRYTFNGLTALLLMSLCANAPASVDVHWAGVGFLGEYTNSNQLYPFSSELNVACGGKNCLDAPARNAFRQKTFTSIRLVDELASKSNNSIGMAVGISYERVRIESLVNEKTAKDQLLVNYVIFANLIFFDLHSNLLRKSVPAYFRYTEVLDSAPSEKHRKSVFRKLYYGKTLGLNIFDELANKANNVDLGTEPNAYAQIRSVTINEEAWKVIGLDIDQRLWAAQIGQIWESSLIDETQAPLLPSLVGHVVGNRLKVRLESGDRMVVLPDPDFKLDLTLRAFKRFEKPAKYSATQCYASAVTVTLHDAFDDPVINSPIRHIPCSLVVNGTTLNHAAEYEKSLISLLVGFSEQLAGKNNVRKYVKRSAPKNPELKDQIKMANQLFFSKYQ